MPAFTNREGTTIERFRRFTATQRFERLREVVKRPGDLWMLFPKRTLADREDAPPEGFRIDRTTRITADSSETGERAGEFEWIAGRGALADGDRPSVKLIRLVHSSGPCTDRRQRIEVSRGNGLFVLLETGARREHTPE